MSLPFLDMLIKRNKAFVRVVDPTDTGLTMNYNAMNYNALAPTKYKKSVVSGLVHRLHQSCSSWKGFQDSLVKTKSMLGNNQYSTQFFKSIISRTLSNIIRNCKNKEGDKNYAEDEVDEKMVFIEYRGKASDSFESSMKKLKVPCKMLVVW